MERRQLLGVVDQQTVGWCDEVNMIGLCGADEDGEPYLLPPKGSAATGVG